MKPSVASIFKKVDEFASEKWKKQEYQPYFMKLGKQEVKELEEFYKEKLSFYSNSAVQGNITNVETPHGTVYINHE